MELRLLRSFLVVAEELHFGRAARRLSISQPPLSAQIKKLEDELGAVLFERTKRKVELTAAGRELCERARRLLAEADKAALEVQRIARGESGSLRIGYAAAATHAVLPALVPRFRASHRDVRLELFEMPSATQPPALRERRIDLGLVCAPVDAPDLRLHVLAREALFVALPAGHPLARRASVSVRALHGAPYVGVRPDIEPGWAGASVRALERAGVSLELVQETDTKIALLGLVAAGLGLSVVSESMQTLGRRGVVFRPLRGLDLHLTLGVVLPPSPQPAAVALVELARSLSFAVLPRRR
ncbi:MAG: LysR substrate-binding domain-containing protein [Polyangiaceae bacterium]